MKLLLKLSLAALLAVPAAFSVAQDAASTPAKPKPPKKEAKGMPQDPGERAFAANCSRCHDAPESLRPSITGTVVRHMRVRANLSAEDERLIRSYLAP